MSRPPHPDHCRRSVWRVVEDRLPRTPQEITPDGPTDALAPMLAGIRIPEIGEQ